MARHYYKARKINYRKIVKTFALCLVISGTILFLYIFFPLISWQIYFAPTFASSKITSPIPSYQMINPANIGGLLSNASSSLSIDYTDAANWYPGIEETADTIVSYSISIPKIKIVDAEVTNKNRDLKRHLVQFNSDTFPGEPGNSVIFGHSTLPQLYNPKDYKTVFANAYKQSKYTT